MIGLKVKCTAVRLLSVPGLLCADGSCVSGFFSGRTSLLLSLVHGLTVSPS